MIVKDTTLQNSGDNFSKIILYFEVNVFRFSVLCLTGAAGLFVVQEVALALFACCAWNVLKIPCLHRRRKEKERIHGRFLFMLATINRWSAVGTYADM